MKLTQKNNDYRPFSREYYPDLYEDTSFKIEEDSSDLENDLERSLEPKNMKFII